MRYLVLIIALAAFAGCRKDAPPQLSLICIGDGFGGADCAKANGDAVYLGPKELKNFWMTTQPDMANFASWCYKTNPATATRAIEDLRASVLRGQ